MTWINLNINGKIEPRWFDNPNDLSTIARDKTMGKRCRYIDCICIDCGNLFVKYEKDTGANLKKCVTCSRKKKVNQIIYNCSNCSEENEYEYRQARFDKNKHHFCSDECRSIWSMDNPEYFKKTP